MLRDFSASSRVYDFSDGAVSKVRVRVYGFGVSFGLYTKYVLKV